MAKKPMVTTNTTLIKIDKILISLSKGSSIDKACKEADIERSTFYNWKNNSEENAAKYYQIIDSRTLVVEDALYKNAVGGNTVAQIFWLKNRAHDRWKDRVDGSHQIDLTLKGEAVVENILSHLGIKG